MARPSKRPQERSSTAARYRMAGQSAGHVAPFVAPLWQFFLERLDSPSLLGHPFRFPADVRSRLAKILDEPTISDLEEAVRLFREVDGFLGTKADLREDILKSERTLRRRINGLLSALAAAPAELRFLLPGCEAVEKQLTEMRERLTNRRGNPGDTLLAMLEEMTGHALYRHGHRLTTTATGPLGTALDAVLHAIDPKRGEIDLHEVCERVCVQLSWLPVTPMDSWPSA